ncbi:MAG: DUF547 domain-containing protein [Planctomycetota bacterium]|nr:DUF547 domain-containing protein [Planctomycetota bacterium]
MPLTAIFALVMLGVGGCKSADPTKPPRPAENLTSFSYADWSRVLTSVVTPDGYVQWDLIQTNKDDVRLKLLAFVGLVQAVSPDNRPELFPHPTDGLAYWINAYNAMSMYGVVTHNYPASVQSMQNDKFVFGGQTLSLLEVDANKVHEIPDGRLYFVLNGCAQSSPPLRNAPYDGAVLDAQLLDQAHVYLRDPRAAARMSDTVIVSEALLQHQREIVSELNQGSTRFDGLLAALQSLAPSDSPITGATSLAGLTFDWSLNRPPR